MGSPDYAPGTQQNLEGVDRRNRHRLQQQINAHDLLIGLGAFAQAAGQARRMKEDQANDAFLAERVQAESGEQPFAQPGAEFRSPTAAGGQYDPQAQETAGQSAPTGHREPVRTARPATMLENLGRTFNPFYRPEGGLTGQGAVQLENLRQNRQTIGRDEQRYQDAAPQRQANLEATRALTIDRLRGGSDGGLSANSIESNFKSWGLVATAAENKLRALQGMTDNYQRQNFISEHGVNEEVLRLQVEHARAQEKRFGDMLNGGQPAAPGATTGAITPNEEGLEPFFEWAEKTARDMGIDPNDEAQMTDPVVDSLIKAWETRQKARAGR